MNSTETIIIQIGIKCQLYGDIAWNPADMENTPEVLGFLLASIVEGQETGRLQRKDCIARHQSIMKGDVGVIRSMVADFAKTTAQRTQQGVGAQMLADSASSWRVRLVVDFVCVGRFHGSLRYQKKVPVSC